MTDLADQLRASLDAQAMVMEVLRDADEILRHGNTLFHQPDDKDAFLATLAAATRIAHTLGDLDRLVRHRDE